MDFNDGDTLPVRNSVQEPEVVRGSFREVGRHERFEEALAGLEKWYDEWRPKPDREAARYVVCVGLAVLHRMREGWPISRAQYISGLDVRTSGPLIRNILAQHGIHRMYAGAGGRTSGAAIVAAESLVSDMNPLATAWNLDANERDEIIDGLQAWLIGKVERYFAAHPVPTLPSRRVLKPPACSEGRSFL